MISKNLNPVTENNKGGLTVGALGLENQARKIWETECDRKEGRKREPMAFAEKGSCT
jgi:hypothetical protein